MTVLSRTGIRRIDILFAVFLLLLTFQYSIPGSYPLAFSLVELAVLAAFLYLSIARPEFLPQLVEEVRTDWIAGLLTLWAVWASLLWVISKDWGYNLNEIRWLFLSVAAYILLREVIRRVEGRAIWIFLGVSVFVALIADIQGLTGIFTPPFTPNFVKDVYTGVSEAQSHTLAVGFFQHPNAFGAFIFWPLMISFGLLRERKSRWIGAAGVVFFAVSLYLSYYRTLFVGVALAIGICLLIWMRLSPRILALTAAGISLLAVAVSALAFLLAPTLNFFSTLWLRIQLWTDASQLIQQSPLILLFGSGFNPAGGQAIAQATADPHDAYLYMLMHYGIPGLLIFAGLIWLILRNGWMAYRDGLLQAQPVLAALWAGWIAWFITDLIDSRLTTADWQMLFVLVLAIFVSALEGSQSSETRKDFPSLSHSR